MNRLLTTICLLTVLVPACVTGASREVAVMVTLEGVSLAQLVDWDIPEIRQQLESGAVGLMNNRTQGGQTFENNSVTISASARGIGFPYSGYGFNVDELMDTEYAAQLYELNTGNDVGSSGVVHLGIAPLLQLNSGRRYEVIPGLLGSQMEEAGVTVAVYGNGDQDTNRSRNAVAIAMNSEGRVPIGDVGRNTTVADARRPFGVRSDYEYLFQSIADLRHDRVFVVIEAGDGRRIDAWRPYLMPAQYHHLKRTTAEECSRFIVRLNEYLKASTDRYLLLFVVPAQEADAASRGDRLTPVIATGSDIVRGVLTSSSTRRPGLITNLDLAPSVLAFFDVQPHPSMIGRPLFGLHQSDPMSMLMSMNNQIVATSNARMTVLYAYVVFLALCVVLTILAVILHDLRSARARLLTEKGILKVLCVTAMLVPLSLLVAPRLGIHGAISSIAFAAIASSALSYALNRWIREPRLIFANVGLVVTAALCVDLLTGAEMIKRSILGYDPIIGARMYGIGNEYSGVLIGAALLGLYSAFDYTGRARWPHFILAALASAGLLVLIGLPGIGTNLGGTVAALFGFGFALVAIRGQSNWRKAFIWTAVFGIVLLATLLGANVMLEADKQSHIGRAFIQAQESDPSLLMDIAVRKWSMNLRLMRYSVWTYVLVSLMIGLAVLFWRPVGILTHILQKHRLMNAGFTGILVGVLVAMVTNDSGITMAATGLIYLVVPLMFMVKVEMEQFPEFPESPSSKIRSLRE